MAYRIFRWFLFIYFANRRLAFMRLNLLNGDSNLLAVDIPLLGELKSLSNKKSGSESFIKNLCLVALSDALNGLVSCEGNLDVIHNLQDSDHA